jgi:threonine aldolase
MKIIDLRSDTVTKPCENMRKVMAMADVGDDVYGDDPTVNRLEKIAAEKLNTEAAIFASSGTQTNLLALLTHCQRGDEYIAGSTAHTYMFEGGGAAVLGSIQPQTVDFEKDYTLSLNKVKSLIKPNDFHFAKTKLLCLENTNFGHTLPFNYLKDARKFTADNNLKLHLDGARLFNAVVDLGVQVSDIANNFDSTSICLSKGLGAPVGSVLCGSNEFIETARRWRKMLGGGMRQAGIVAAGGIYALENNVERLGEDHDNATYLAESLSGIDEIKIKDGRAKTNMVFVDLNDNCQNELEDFFRKAGIIISAYELDSLRLVMHLNINRNDCKKIVRVFKDFFSKKGRI